MFFWRWKLVRMFKRSESSVLDVGTGTGDLAKELVEHVALRVVGVDFSVNRMINAARARGNSSGSENARL